MARHFAKDNSGEIAIIELINGVVTGASTELHHETIADDSDNTELLNETEVTQERADWYNQNRAKWDIVDL